MTSGRTYGPMKAVVVTDPEGREMVFASQSEAARATPLRQSTVSQLCLGKIRQCKGWTARFKDAPLKTAPPMLPADPATPHLPVSMQQG